MKNLLVILMLGAGFVTTASALDDINNISDQCILDASNITNAMYQNVPHGIITTDGISVIHVYADAYISAPGICNDGADYRIDGGKHIDRGIVEWQAGNWTNTIKLDNK